MTAYYSRPPTQFPVGTELAADDIVLVTDISDSAPSHPSGLTKKYTMGVLQMFLEEQALGSDIATAKAAAAGNIDATYLNGTAGVGATLTNNANGALVIDGHALSVGDRWLAPYQSSSYANGVYQLTIQGDSITRAVSTRVSDFDGSFTGKIRQGDFIGILFGSVNPLSWWFLTSPSVAVVGTDPIVFQKQTLPVTEAWIATSDPTVQMEVNTGYTVISGSTLTLPALSAVGEWVELNGHLYTIAQNAGNTIYFGGIGNSTTGTGGSLSSTSLNSSIKLRCVTANSSWDVVAEVGTFTIF